MLYLPWRKEKEDILDQNLEEIFKINCDKIKAMKQKYNAFDDEVLNIALQEAENRAEEDESSEVEHEGEQTSETFALPSSFDFDNFKLDEDLQLNINTEDNNEDSDNTRVTFTSPGKLPDKEFQKITFHKLPEDKNLKNATHIFAKNKDVNNHNEEALKKIKNPQYICTASDILEGHGSDLAKRQLLYSAANSKIQDTVGMPTILTLKEKARYMVTYNINTEDGICNGATGQLK
ncbi:2,3-bisphosphoglycerate-independent phosphoglycerate mutase [Frankliniella fusca]|uniref:2,3-bisphosphoglycerate-independent phosphoglycerate mutase n=1 Tax=Frankliniella fusca TaxID=407009 RepID=A0AAE1LC10_9NEOP|nr:2,3-bisphosphoglycerate-independent phosphoglycerate mutase [Frankliniella fusca]